MALVNSAPEIRLGPFDRAAQNRSKRFNRPEISSSSSVSIVIEQSAMWCSSLERTRGSLPSTSNNESKNGHIVSSNQTSELMRTRRTQWYTDVGWGWCSGKGGRYDIALTCQDSWTSYPKIKLTSVMSAHRRWETVSGRLRADPLVDARARATWRTLLLLQRHPLHQLRMVEHKWNNKWQMRTWYDVLQQYRNENRRVKWLYLILTQWSTSFLAFRIQ